jgi:uncharacterized Fe-S radical SAM superfamily protein PflX
MRKSKRILNETMSSLEYKRALKEQATGVCKFCKWHCGCNRSNRLDGISSWKEYRKNQYKP